MSDPMQNLDAEQAVLGGLLLDPSLLDSLPTLTPGAFYKPAHGTILAALHTARRDCDGKVDHLAVLEVLRQRNELQLVGGGPYLHECIQACPSTAQAPYYARLVMETAHRRELLVTAQRIVQAAQQPDMEAAKDNLADMWAALGLLLDQSPGTTEAPDVHEFGEFVGRSRSFRREWVIPGLLAPMERVIVVASEGAGKTTWSRTIAVGVGQGLHPLNPRVRIPKRRVLIVDLENPPDLIADQSRRLIDVVHRGTGGWDSENVWLWSRPAGVNLRKHSDVALLDRVMAHVRPDLMVLGPLYKASLDGSDRGEQVAQEVTAALDTLRTRHRCALWLEHHAPMEQNGHRPMRPVSSGVWTRWPEFGLALQLDTGDPSSRTFSLGRFRRDRDQGRIWPDAMAWGDGWPWEPIYHDGPPAELRTEEAS